MSIKFLDVEANGFLESATKVHCLSVKEPGKEPYTLTEGFADFFASCRIDLLVWHNGFGYDVPLLHAFGVDEARCDLDTLAISRDYWPENPRGHSLDAWATFLGYKKPKITDWDNLPIEVYTERCEEDVKTTEAVYNYLLNKLGV